MDKLMYGELSDLAVFHAIDCLWIVRLQFQTFCRILSVDPFYNLNPYLKKQHKDELNSFSLFLHCMQSNRKCGQRSWHI